MLIKCCSRIIEYAGVLLSQRSQEFVASYKASLIFRNVLEWCQDREALMGLPEIMFATTFTGFSAILATHRWTSGGYPMDESLIHIIAIAVSECVCLVPQM